VLLSFIIQQIVHFSDQEFLFLTSPMNQNALILGKVWPEPLSSAAGSRMLQLINALKEQGYSLTFASAAGDSIFMSDLKALGIEKCSIQLNDSSFDIFLKELNPALVLFDRFTTEEQYGWRVAEHCPHALRVLDTEDLHCLRAARQLALKEKRNFELLDLNSAIAYREIASIYRCDLSLIISEFELHLLQNHFKIDPSLLLYLPFMLETIGNDNQLQWPNFTQRKHFISIGNFLHEPNWDAVVYLKQEIWPLIRKHLPTAEVHIYGAYPSHKVFELHHPKNGFLIKGRAKLVSEVMSQAKVCLAPLRFGAGLKGKLIDAMLCGTPSVTTELGKEAMHAELPWNGTIANDPNNFANAAVELYSNELLWTASQKNGIQIINSLYSKTLYQTLFIASLQSIQTNLKVHRLKNFMGSMLMQHTTQSSRYMALWIEAKNKNTRA